MKYTITLILLFCSLLSNAQSFFWSYSGCVELSTNSVTDITTSTATCGGNITTDAGSPITARGVCWSTSLDPTIADSKTSDGSGTGSFTSYLTGLSPDVNYYVRAYATNSLGTFYGVHQTFATNCRPDGMVTMQFYSQVNGTSISSGNVCYYTTNFNCKGSCLTINGQLISLTAENFVYDTDYKKDCSKRSDGYYVMVSLDYSAKYAVRILGGKLYYITC